MNTTIIVVVVALGVTVAFWLWRRNLAISGASNLAKQVFPVWAAQGPFNSGAESAAAMRGAYLAVFGEDQAEGMLEAVAGHEAAFDRDPETWEETRQVALEGVREDAIALAEGIKAANALNQGFIEGSGRRLEFVKQPNGTTQVEYKQIWSDEKIEEKKREDGIAIGRGMGTGLMNDPSPEAQALVTFLTTVYESDTGEEADAYAIGSTWFAFIGMEEDEEEGNSEFFQTFKELNDAHGRVWDERDKNGLEWGENPGCFERHLQRKLNNPLFPEEKREITQAEVFDARARDNEDAETIRGGLLEITEQIVDLEESITFDDVTVLRKKIDDLIDDAVGIGGQADLVVDALKEIRVSLLDSVRETLYSKDGLAALEEAEALRKNFMEAVHTPFSAQLIRLESEDIIPAMLSESPDTIRAVMQMMDDQNIDLIVANAEDIYNRALDEGANIPQADEKIRALRGFQE